MVGAVTVRDPKAMQALGGQMAQACRGGEVVLLYGELGAGKTTLVQGMAAGLGVPQAVTSPSYTIVAVYPTGHPTIRELVHVDLYRLTDQEAAQEAAVREALVLRSDQLVVVEWAERLGARVPSGARRVRLEHGTHAGERRACFSS